MFCSLSATSLPNHYRIMYKSILLCIRACICSLQYDYRTYFASRANAITPDATGVAALVPSKLSVHSFITSVVLCKGARGSMQGGVVHCTRQVLHGSGLIRRFALHNLCDLNPTSWAASVAQLVERLP